jgi:hypothetical protein
MKYEFIQGLYDHIKLFVEVPLSLSLYPIVVVIRVNSEQLLKYN